MSTPLIDPRAAALFAAQGLMRTLGARLLEARDGVCRIEAPIGPAVTQHQGVGHAGLTFALGDTASGFAAHTLMADDRVPVTVEMKVNLMAPAAGDRLAATGRVARVGRTLTVVTAEVVAWTEDGPRVAALMQGTMMSLPA